MENFIPKALESKRDIFLATKMPFVHIEPFETDELLSPWTSKYLGTPYLPKGGQYPYDINGRPLALLAQINFSEIPRLEGYPTSGILQFFISDDDLYGLEFSKLEFGEPYDSSKRFRLQQQQNKFRVVYYPDVIENLSLLTDSFDFLPEFEFLPVYKQCRLEFSLREELAGINDYRFAKLFGKNFYPLDEDEEPKNNADYQVIFSSGSKIGGYADFTQEDIRFLAPPEENWLLLLQIGDEAESADIMWGDAGIGNFFIEEKDLEARDFSRVLYNWDCG